MRDPQDVYLTHAWVTQRLLEAVKIPGGLWLEPSAGNGDIINATSSVRSDVIWHCVELRDECIPTLDSTPNVQVCVAGNFLAVPPDDRYAAVLGNPPYVSSLKFVQHALKFSSLVVFLLRLDWLAPAKQSRWVRSHMPDVALLPNRPDFTGDGGDSTEYAWMSFHREERTEGRILLLAETPLEERRGIKGKLRERGQKELFAE